MPCFGDFCTIIITYAHICHRRGGGGTCLGICTEERIRRAAIFRLLHVLCSPLSRISSTSLLFPEKNFVYDEEYNNCPKGTSNTSNQKNSSKWTGEAVKLLKRTFPSNINLFFLLFFFQELPRRPRAPIEDLRLWL